MNTDIKRGQSWHGSNPLPPAKPPQTISFDAAQKAHVLAKNAVQLAEFAATALISAEDLGNKTNPLEHSTRSPAQREILLAVPEISKSIKIKLTKKNSSFTVSEVASMTMALTEVSIEGDRACPPEDVGGIYGFFEFLEVLADPKHEQHDDFIEWGGNFAPEKIDAKQATKEMKKRLPDWRSMR